MFVYMGFKTAEEAQKHKALFTTYTIDSKYNSDINSAYNQIVDTEELDSSKYPYILYKEINLSEKTSL